MKVMKFSKRKKDLDLEISYILYVNITAFFKTKLFLIVFKQNFHPCICVYSNMMAKQLSTS